jgi:uncharacterized repeat protein (TIGR01451 family)
MGLGTLALLALLAAVSATPTRAAPPAERLSEAPNARLAAPLRQTTTTPTYVVSDSLTGGIDYDWVEISGSGTPIALSGDNWGSGSTAIGLYFPFYDAIYQAFRVSTNGYIYFDGLPGDGAAVPTMIGHVAAPNNFIAPFGADLYLDPEVSRVYVDRQGNRTVIEFVDVQWCCGLNDPHTFEIILYPDGRILTQYRQVRFLSNPSVRVVAGIEGSTDSLAYYEDWFEENTLLNDGLAVLYDPGDSVFGHILLDPPAPFTWDDPGQTIGGDVALVNLTGFADTFDITYNLSVSSSVVPDPDLWPVSMPLSAALGSGTVIFPVPNTGSTAFPFTATIPLAAAWSDLARLEITVSSAASPTISSTIAITYGVAQRDLRVEKRLQPDTAPAPGGYFRYRISVTNDDYAGSGRGATARDVRVTDTLPLSATFLSFYGPGVITGPMTTTRVFTWNVGDMYAYQTVNLDVRMQVPTSVLTGTVMTNTVWTAMWDSVERAPDDANVFTHTFVVTEPWLIFDVDKYFPGPNQIGPGQVATYTVRLVNRGNVPVAGAIVSDTLPQGTTFHGTTWPTWTATTSRTLVFTISDVLPNGDWDGDWNVLAFQVGVNVPATMPIGTWLTNTVQATTTASLADFVLAHGDRDDEVIQVIDPRGDVWVTKHPETLGGNPVIPEPGRDYTFWLNYGNRGYVTVYTVTLTDVLPLPARVTLLDAGPAGTASPDTLTPGAVVWHIPELTPGASGWARVRILIGADTPTGSQLVNTAHITNAVGLNISPTNDLSVVAITLRATDVTVDKWVTPTGMLQVGDWLTYSVRFSNTGVLTATGVRITDTLPAGLTNVTWLTEGHPIESLPALPPFLVWRALLPLDTGQGGLITVSGQLDPAFNWPALPQLTNRAEINTSRGEEPVNAPNVAQVSNPVALAWPYVVKTGPTLALPGKLVSYTIHYGNPGLLPAQGVRLTDTLPVSTTYVRNDSPWGEPLSGTTGLNDWLAWDAGTILSDTDGLTFTLVLSLSPAAPVGLPLRNTVVLTSASYDGNRTDNESTWVTPVGFDLSGSYKQVNGSDGLDVGAGTPVTYSIVLTNRGPYSATSVAVWDPLPADTAYVAGSLSGPGSDYGYDPAGDLITWTGVVSGNTALTLTFQVTVADAGPLPRGTLIINTAFISDSVQTFQASVPITISGPDLDRSYKAVSNPYPAPNERITYTIVLVNDGELDASTRVTDVLPLEVRYAGGGWASSGLMVVSDITGTGTLSMGGWSLVTWTGTVTVGQRVTLTLPVTVVAAAGSSFVNSAQVDDGAGMVFWRSVGVSMAAPNLDVPGTRKQASASAVSSGARVTYTITLYNGGDGLASSVRVSDVLQGGTYSGGGSASSGVLDDSNAPTIAWNGALASGQSVIIVIPVVITATPGSDVPNVVEIDDGYNAVFSRTTTVHVYSLPDLSGSNKSVDPGAARVGDTLDYALTVNNSGETASAFSVTDTLDADTAFVGFMGTPPGGYGYAAGVITWTGTVNGMGQAQLAFQATISEGASVEVLNTARFDDGAGGLYTDTATTLIIAPQLSATKQVVPENIAFAGTALTYSVVMRNVGGDVAQVSLSDAIPTYTLYVGGSAQVPPGYPPPLYDGQGITWQGDLAPDAVVTLTYNVFIEPGVPNGAVITNVAWLQELSEPGPLFSVTVTNTVQSPVFGAAKGSTPPNITRPGQVLNYSITLTNVLDGIARVVITDPVPLNTTYISMSTRVQASALPLAFWQLLSPSDGGYNAPQYDPDNNLLTWSGDVSPRSVVTLTFAVTVNSGVSIGVVITNTAWVDELSDPAPAVAYQAFNLVVAYELYLPLVVKLD